MSKLGKLNPEVILRKSIYDKVAATIILKKFIDFYHDASGAKFISDDLPVFETEAEK
eukprot:CAMPEP_0168626548 /NCGR_PEP_ID=MMETSP0449_2-20121227/10702_1 /TAXON_ID=1082188 /ORGANISM="Strombidium rassoulzadegani, Strain ras09" /LENGTH=56 /DNA_ID=CAMNT_0008668573 /DNA_START=87 /DNA_END=257 /DNA_ORIENTATION=-